MLRVRGSDIVDAEGRSIRLRGVCVGGWMNMENFINGYPGDESGARRAMGEILGPARAEFLFDRWLDYFFNEDDAAYLKESGANVVRLPLNYRHFEADAEPYRYLEKGFERLSKVIGACARAGLYVILDLHAVQGWQNTDWHSDNASRHSLIWGHPHFQDRFIALWKEIARRYRGVGAVAGYNLMNEPFTGVPAGRFRAYHPSDWAAINKLYRRAVDAVREIDADHIIFLEGDYYSTRFSKLEPPFAPNLVYSSHNYTPAGLFSGKYPGKFDGKTWNQKRQADVFSAGEGTVFTKQNQVPLWVGEFGSLYTGPVADSAYRLRALDEQIAVFEQHAAHWTIWTYKDVGVMGIVTLDPKSEYMRLIRPILRAKHLLGADSWLDRPTGKTPVHKAVKRLAGIAERTIGDPEIDHPSNRRYMAQALQAGYFASLMQPAFAKRFKGLSESQIDGVMQSFAFRNCKVQKGLAEVMKKYWRSLPETPPLREGGRRDDGPARNAQG